MARKSTKTTMSALTDLNDIEYPEYLIYDKNVFLDLLKREKITKIKGNECTAADVVREIVKRKTMSEDINIMEYLKNFHPITWITHALGPWEDNISVKNPTQTFANLQDKWLEKCHLTNIYKQGKLSNVKWTDFKRHWNTLYGRKFEGLNSDEVVNWILVSIEEEAKQKKQLEEAKRNEMHEKIRKAQEEGARRTREEEKRKEQLRLEEEARIERQKQHELEEAKRIEREELERAETLKRKQEEEEAEWQRMLAEEANESTRKEQPQDDDLFSSESDCIEVDDTLFDDGSDGDFLRPKYRKPVGNEVRINAEDGTFTFGPGVSTSIISSRLTYMRIESVKNSMYFTFSQSGGVPSSIDEDSLVLIERKSGAAQMIDRLGKDDECVFVRLSSNVSVISKKLAFMVEGFSKV